MAPKRLPMCLAVQVVLLWADSSYAASNVYAEPYVVVAKETITLPAGRNTSYEVSVPRGAILAGNITVHGGTNNKVRLLLLDLDNFQRYAARKPFEVIKGASGDVTGTARFKAPLPGSNVYRLVVDNQGAAFMSRTVQVYAYAILPEPTLESLKAAKGFETAYASLKQLFVFEDFKIALHHCGQSNAFSNPDIHMCIELVEEYTQRGLPNALLFIFFHELGHTFLKLWGSRDGTTRTLLMNLPLCS
jgi:hypothetical protein